MHDPDEIIEAAEREKEAIREHYLPAVEWFLEHPGLDRRRAVVDDLAAHLDVDREVASTVVGHLVSDDVDPVQQVVRPTDGKYVGVIDHAEHEWFYAFDRYDDVDGRERRAVCAHCVHEERSVDDVAHFTRRPDEYDLARARAALGLHYHVDHEGRALAAVLEAELGVDPAAFARRHGVPDPAALSLRDVTRRLGSDPDLREAVAGGQPGRSVPDVDVEPGASLISGTTIAGNPAWHAGNDGPGSNLDADTLDGKQLTEITTTTTTVTTKTTKDYGGAVTSINTFPVTASSARLAFSYTGADTTFGSFAIYDVGTLYSNPTKVWTTITTTQTASVLFDAYDTAYKTFEVKLYY